MTTQQRASVFAKLRLCGAMLMPATITALLGEKPTYAAVAGERVWATNPPITQHTTGVWELESLGRVFSADPDEHVSWLVQILDRADRLAFELPNVERAEIYCNWSSFPDFGGPCFSPVVLGNLSRHGLILTVDCQNASWYGRGGTLPPPIQSERDGPFEAWGYHVREDSPGAGLAD